METKLAIISQLSKENPDMVLTSLGHLINKEMLKNCHIRMDGTKAARPEFCEGCTTVRDAPTRPMKTVKNYHE